MTNCSLLAEELEALAHRLERKGMPFSAAMVCKALIQIKRSHSSALSDLESILADHADAHDNVEIRAECGITFGMVRDVTTLAALRCTPASTSDREALTDLI